ncbi:hypothetical protein MTO96_033261 [Rhipicephalus appendiculatus]
MDNSLENCQQSIDYEHRGKDEPIVQGPECIYDWCAAAAIVPPISGKAPTQYTFFIIESRLPKVCRRPCPPGPGRRRPVSRARRRPREACWQGLRTGKGLAAGAIFGTLLVFCVVLVAALLIYLLLSDSDKGHAVASPPSVTPDDDHSDHGGENATTDGTTELAPAADAALHNVAAGARHHTYTLAAVTARAVSSSEGGSAGNAARPRDNDVSTKATTRIGGHPNAARTIRNRPSTVREIALMEAALIDGEVSSDFFALPHIVDNEGSKVNFTNDSAVLTSTGTRREVHSAFGLEQETSPDLETPEYSNESTGEVADTQTSAQQEGNSAGNKLLHRTKGTYITISFSASTGALANDIDDDNFVMSATKGPRHLPSNDTTNFNYNESLRYE